MSRCCYSNLHAEIYLPLFSISSKHKPHLVVHGSIFSWWSWSIITKRCSQASPDAVFELRKCIWYVHICRGIHNCQNSLMDQRRRTAVASHGVQAFLSSGPNWTVQNVVPLPTENVPIEKWLEDNFDEVGEEGPELCVNELSAERPMMLSVIYMSGNLAIPSTLYTAGSTVRQKRKRCHAVRAIVSCWDRARDYWAGHVWRMDNLGYVKIKKLAAFLKEHPLSMDEQYFVFTSHEVSSLNQFWSRT